MVINLAQFEEPFQIIKKMNKKLYFKNENLREQQNFSIINHFFILIHQMDFFLSVLETCLWNSSALWNSGRDARPDAHWYLVCVNVFIQLWRIEFWESARTCSLLISSFSESLFSTERRLELLAPRFVREGDLKLKNNIKLEFGQNSHDCKKMRANKPWFLSKQLWLREITWLWATKPWLQENNLIECKLTMILGKKKQDLGK
jgi:hypothetical protein